MEFVRSNHRVIRFWSPMDSGCAFQFLGQVVVQRKDEASRDLRFQDLRSQRTEGTKWTGGNLKAWSGGWIVSGCGGRRSQIQDSRSQRKGRKGLKGLKGKSGRWSEVQCAASSVSAPFSGVLLAFPGWGIVFARRRTRPGIRSSPFVPCPFCAGLERSRSKRQSPALFRMDKPSDV